MRNECIRLGISQMSAGSHVDVGSYSGVCFRYSTGSPNKFLLCRHSQRRRRQVFHPRRLPRLLLILLSFATIRCHRCRQLVMSSTVLVPSATRPRLPPPRRRLLPLLPRQPPMVPPLPPLPRQPPMLPPHPPLPPQPRYLRRRATSSRWPNLCLPWPSGVTPKRNPITNLQPAPTPVPRASSQCRTHVLPWMSSRTSSARASYRAGAPRATAVSAPVPTL